MTHLFSLTKMLHTPVKVVVESTTEESRGRPQKGGRSVICLTKGVFEFRVSLVRLNSFLKFIRKVEGKLVIPLFFFDQTRSEQPRRIVLDHDL